MSTNFRPGQKVVCINVGEWIPGIGKPDMLELNAVYTIREYAAHPDYPDVICVRLVEVSNDNFDSPFAAGRFRPVVKKKTDISELQKLTKVREREQV